MVRKPRFARLGKVMEGKDLILSNIYTKSDFGVLVSFMCHDVLIEKHGGQYGCFSTINYHYSNVWS